MSGAPPPTIRDIQLMVCDWYGLPLATLLGRARSKKIAHARHVAMFVTRKCTSRSFPEIGRAFCRDHSTVIHAVQTIEKLLSHPSASFPPLIAERIADMVEGSQR